MPTGIYKRTPEMYESRRGKPSWNKGGTLSKSHRKKLSIAHKGLPSGNYKGQSIHGDGRIFIVCKDHPYRDKNHNYVARYRLVVEEKIGRYLLPTESVHHHNEIKFDDRPKNLMAFTSESAHVRWHHIMKGHKSKVEPHEIIFDGRTHH